MNTDMEIEIVAAETGAIMVRDTLAHCLSCDDGLREEETEIRAALALGETYTVRGGAAAAFIIRPAATIKTTKPANHPDTLAHMSHDEVVMETINIAHEWNDLELHALNTVAMEALVDCDDAIGAPDEIDRIIGHVQRKMEDGHILPPPFADLVPS